MGVIRVETNIAQSCLEITMSDLGILWRLESLLAAVGLPRTRNAPCDVLRRSFSPPRRAARRIGRSQGQHVQGFLASSTGREAEKLK